MQFSKITTVLVLFWAIVRANYYSEDELEDRLIQANLAEDVTKINDDLDQAGDASHGSAYKSIISNYYIHDPYFGAAVSPKMSKNEAVKKLKKILMKRRINTNDQPAEPKMEQDESITREMIPAPLLSRANGQYAEERISERIDKENGNHNMDGIPAPLLVGGAYRSKQRHDDFTGDKVMKKTLELVEDKPMTRMHVKKSHNNNNGVQQRFKDDRDDQHDKTDELQERSVFSELIGQRQQRPPTTTNKPKVDTNIDAGFIDIDIDDDEDGKTATENRGFFPDKNFKNGFNPDRKKYSFPGDERKDIPRLPEIENRENREPDVYNPRAKPSYSYFDIMDEFFDKPAINIFPERPEFNGFQDSYHGQPVKRNPESYHGQPVKRNPEPYAKISEYPGTAYGHEYRKPLSYHNPMDYGHNHGDIDVFSHKPLRYESREPSYQRPVANTGFYNEPSHHQNDNFFVDVPKINIAKAIDGGSFSKTRDPLNHPDIARQLDDFPHLETPSFNPPVEAKPQFRSLDDPAPRLKRFPTFDGIRNDHFVADMPHLPPPPEMIELQKNSLFPVDVPKIGVDAPYRPPELIFDEFHRGQNHLEKKPFKRQIEAKRNPSVEGRRERPSPPRPINHSKMTLKKFSDLDMIITNERSVDFAQPAEYLERAFEPVDEDEFVHDWDQESRFKQYSRESEYRATDEPSKNEYKPSESRDRESSPQVAYDRRDYRYDYPVEKQPKSSYDEKPRKSYGYENEERYETQKERFQHEDATDRSFRVSEAVPQHKIESQPTPETFHNQIEDELDFRSPPKTHFYMNEAVKQVDPPVYAPKDQNQDYSNFGDDDQNYQRQATNTYMNQNQEDYTNFDTDQNYQRESAKNYMNHKNEDYTNYEAEENYQKGATNSYKNHDVIGKYEDQYSRYYKQDYDDHYDLPMRPETEPEPVTARHYYDASAYVAEQPEYFTKYDPMEFAKKARTEEQVRDFQLPAFPDFPAFDESEFRTKALSQPRVSDRRSANYGRSLTLAPALDLEGPAYLEGNDHEQPHQFAHVDGPETFKAGHSRGNYHHHIRDTEEHAGPHHLQEEDTDDFTAFMAEAAASASDDWGQRIKF